MTATDEWVRGGPRETGAAPPEAFTRALAPFAAELAELRPEGAELCDIHTHLGADEDGRSLTLDALLEGLDQGGVQRACVFPLHDPDRHPAYRVPNDRVLGWAGESEGRLSPFCRLDPNEDPVAEGERCLAAGAEGIKLHPRAQAFAFDVPEMDAIFGLAEDAQAPLLIHMGRGMPPVADGLVALAERHPRVRLVLAHAGVADQGVLCARLRDHPGIFYDTSVWSAIDLLELFARTSPDRIAFGSDPPYGRTFAGLYLALRTVRAVGGSPEDAAAVAGGAAAALLARGELPPPRPPLGEKVRPRHGTLQRISGYGMQAFGALFVERFDLAAEMLGLAVAAARDPEPGSDEVAETLARLGESLRASAELMRDPDTGFFGAGLLHLSLTLAGTTA